MKLKKRNLKVGDQKFQEFILWSLRWPVSLHELAQPEWLNDNEFTMHISFAMF